MVIDLIKLRNKDLIVDEDIVFDKNIYQNKDIVLLKDIHIKGIIRYNELNNIAINLKLTGDMILKDSVSLDNISYPLDLVIEEELEENSENFYEYYEKKQNILDIMKILWENIVLEVPIRFTNVSDAQMKGEGWSLGGQDNFLEIDPRLAKLNELLGEGKE